MKHLLRSFAGGEITPELFGRVDLTKFQTGMQLLQNFVPLPHGPFTRRAGTKYVLEAKDSTRPVRVIPFEFSVDQTVAIEFGHLYCRFHIGGQTLVETAISVTSVVLGPTNGLNVNAHGYTTGDWVFYIGGVGVDILKGRACIVTVIDANNISLSALNGTAIDTTGQTPYAGGATVARVYTVASPYSADDLFDLHYAQSNDVLTLVHPSYAARELRRLGATNWQFSTISFASTLAAPTGVGVVATIAVPGNQSPHSYVVTAVAADGITESLASSAVTTSNNLTVAGNYNTVSWSAVVGAARYNVYKKRGGSFGYIGQTTGLNTVDDNVLADTLKTPPEEFYTLNGSATNFPSAVTYYEQRRFFAGTDAEPQTIYATRSGTEANLTSSVPSQADDALKFKIASRQQNRVRHLVALSDLLPLTPGGEWRVYSDNEPALTPTSLTVKPQGYSGASNVQPAVTSGSVLYVQAQGSRVRELAYNWETNAFRSIDLSLMAPHLFNLRSMTELAYCRAPDQGLWALRDDGAALYMAYVPEQQVYGWSRHTTDGAFESVCAIAENNEDAVYFVVARAVNGRAVRYIERLQSRLFESLAEAFFVDSGLTYNGVAVTSVSGLHHLEGKTVAILADGAVETPQVVVNGAVTFREPTSLGATAVVVGLAMTSDAQTLPLTYEAQAAGQGTMKNVSKVHLRVFQSSACEIGPAFDKLRTTPPRPVATPYGSPPPVRTEEISVSVDPSWSTDGSVCIRKSDPTPLTVVAMVLDVAAGG